jgi:hypothetical protein
MSSVRSRLFSFGLVLVGLFGTAYAVGERLPGHEHTGAGGHVHGGSGDQHGAGRTEREPASLGLLADDGVHRLVVDEVTSTSLRFTVTRSGQPVTELMEMHGAVLHLVLVRSDLSGFQHVHPQLDGDRWSVDGLDLQPGTWRMVVDAVATDGTPFVLGTMIDRPGEVTPLPLPPTDDMVDVTVGSQTLMVMRNGTSFTVSPTDQLASYLGAPAHLVAIRAGDLAYAHLHPSDDVFGDYRFDGSLPGTGTYRLFLQFGHRSAPGDAVTAPFTVEVP